MPVPDLRIVIVAENASFRFGGEAALPLHYFSRLLERGIPAWLIVHARTHAELDALFPHQRERILSIPDTRLHKLLWLPSKLLPHRIHDATFGTLITLLTQLLQRKLVAQLVRDHAINIVHQPTPVSPKAPSFLFALGIPVVIGPMNGGMEYPPAFRTAESPLTRLSIALARRAANLINRLIPGKRDAAILLVANPRTQAALPTCVRGQVLHVPENGIDLRIWRPPARPSPTHPENQPAPFLFIGRLVDWKRLDLVLHALARVPQATLEVIGDGPMRVQWTALTRTLALDSRVHFLGWLSQPECAQRLETATALVLPSIFECGGAVVLEAMATATPVIATAWGGPADYLNPACGFLIEPASPEALIAGFAEAMHRLARDPALRTQLGNAARAKVEQPYDWERKLDHMLTLYAEAIRLNAASKSPR